jgi:hypothetical protein
MDRGSAHETWSEGKDIDRLRNEKGTEDFCYHHLAGSRLAETNRKQISDQPTFAPAR